MAISAAADAGRSEFRARCHPLIAPMPQMRATVVLVHGAWRGPLCWELRTPYRCSTSMAADRAGPLFYSDCPDAIRDWAVAQLRPHLGQALSKAGGPAGLAPAAEHLCRLRRAAQALPPRIQREGYGPRAQGCGPRQRPFAVPVAATATGAGANRRRELPLYCAARLTDAASESGGTGRRAGFRFQWGNPWGFESLLSHQAHSRRLEFQNRI